MPGSDVAAGVVGPFAGLDVPWLLRLRAEVRRDHPFLIWAPFDAPARSWTYGAFHDRVGALAAGFAARGVKPGEYVLIHLDNCIESLLAWFACAELGAIAVTTNTRSAATEVAYFADHCGAVAGRLLLDGARMCPHRDQVHDAGDDAVRWVSGAGL